MSDPTTRPDHCKNCGNWLMGFEQRGDSRMCNRCLDIAHDSGDVSYDEYEDDDQLRAQENVIERTYSKAFKGGVAMFALALALMGGTASAKLSHVEAAPIIEVLQPLVPDGCALERVYEDYTGMAVCAGSYVLWVNGQDDTTDIPYAIGERTVGPDANGKFWTWAIYD